MAADSVALAVFCCWIAPDSEAVAVMVVAA